MIAPFLPPHDCQKPYSIFEINSGVAESIERSNCLVWVEGEISNCKAASSGHIYLTLKDTESQISAVMWKSTAQKIAILPENGMMVSAIAIIRVYKKGGTYQLDIQKLQLAGEGARAKALLKLKLQLTTEGLFDSTRKKPIPHTVRRLGVITSLHGAALQDIIRVVSMRSPQTDVIIADSAVQGESAPIQLVRGIRLMHELATVDCVIIGRGGGSTEDLWAFNDERVVRAICACSKPIISAIGHETDYTLADLAADLRAPTPSAAIEMVIPDTEETSRFFLSIASRVLTQCMGFLRSKHTDFSRLTSRFGLKRPQRIIDEGQQTLDLLGDRMRRAHETLVHSKKAALMFAAGKLNALSPLTTLSRGYCIATKAPNIPLKNAANLHKGDFINLRFSQGSAHCKVLDIANQVSPPISPSP